MRSRPRGAPAKVIGCARQMGKAKSGEILRFEPPRILLEERVAEFGAKSEPIAGRQKS
jgi:hypothetical protein